MLKPDVPADSGTGEIGVNHIAYTYASAADLLETYARLKEQGHRAFILPIRSANGRN